MFVAMMNDDVRYAVVEHEYGFIDNEQVRMLKQQCMTCLGPILTSPRGGACYTQENPEFEKSNHH